MTEGHPCWAVGYYRCINDADRSATSVSAQPHGPMAQLQGWVQVGRQILARIVSMHANRLTRLKQPPSGRSEAMRPYG